MKETGVQARPELKASGKLITTLPNMHSTDFKSLFEDSVHTAEFKYLFNPMANMKIFSSKQIKENAFHWMLTYNCTKLFKSTLSAYSEMKHRAGYLVTNGSQYVTRSQTISLITGKLTKTVYIKVGPNIAQKQFFFQT